MTDQSIRQTLSSAVGTIDHAIAVLSRAECGEARDLVARARVDLKSASSELLVLRAKLCGDSINERSARIVHHAVASGVRDGCCT